MTADVTLEEMLAARDARAARQAALAARHGLEGDAVGAVVSITLVTPGTDKNPPWAERVFAAALAEVDRALPPGTVVHAEEHASPAGPHGLRVVTGVDALTVKRLLVEVEETHAWGRLFDLDVLDHGVPLTRGDVGAPARRCLVCDAPAAGCARSRAHDLTALHATIAQVVA